MQKHPSLVFYITARYFACMYNLQVDLFPHSNFLRGKKESKKWHPEGMFAGERMVALDSEIG